jgi:hypothetical protein
LELDTFSQPKTLKFDGNRKKGVIKNHSYENEPKSQETTFELVPIKSERALTKSPKRFWQFSARGENM